MELFLIYFVTRLTELKSHLDVLSVVTGVLLTAVIIVYAANEFFTTPKDKDAEPTSHKGDSSVFLYQGIRRSSRRSLRYLIPFFAVSFVLNMLLPSSKDAIAIAGGYGLVEAVKNDTVQRLFHKSSQVATSWLDAQLGADAPAKVSGAASAASASIAATASAPAAAASNAAVGSSAPDGASSNAGTKAEAAVDTVTSALGTVKKLGDAASQVQGAIAAVKQSVQ
ncbi:hypothetical protein [Burkholderia cenocepacia]|uniref:hypothetical protein n=1 Tax=Burkholderia cenocepacia TaxID=95486 RepID=UPI000761B310|nr:hypothetical protein [Burkholderia cenocepacia]KWU19201.1 hypothetical protein AS149_13225 [Burkholderia cenocepacia]